MTRFSRTRATTLKARRLRVQATTAEQALWQVLRAGQVDGLAFRRQHPMGAYVLDFYCPAIRLAIELDGGQHNMPVGLERDVKRARWLRSRGVNVLRFWNTEVSSNRDGVVSEIARMAAALGAGRTTPTLTLPLSGGGKMDPLDIVFGEVDR